MRAVRLAKFQSNVIGVNCGSLMVSTMTENIWNIVPTFLVRAGQDVEQRVPLRLVGAFVYDRLEDALTVMDGAGKVERADHREAIKAYLVAMALVDLEGH